jgi:DNA-binding XRE family transcriptional regulator
MTGTAIAVDDREQEAPLGVADALCAPTGARTLPPFHNLMPVCATCHFTFVGEPRGMLRVTNVLGVNWWTGATFAVDDERAAIVRVDSGATIFQPVIAVREPDLSVVARIEHVRRHLSLTMTHLAAIVGVTRTTLYAWQDGTSAPRERSLRRLGELAEVATQWAERSTEPVGAFLVTPLSGGATLFDLLSALQWDNAVISAAIDTLVTAVKRAPARTRATDQRTDEERRRAEVRESRRLFRPR